jgi:nucleotide-binding universal stress UspA family protein
MDESFIPEGSGTAAHGPRRPVFVVGVDGSDSGRAALAEAARNAALVNAHIVAVHVRAQPSIGELAALVAPGAALISRDCRDLLEMQAWLDCVQVLDPAQASWEFNVISGRPDKRLSEVVIARHGDALFVGQSHRTSWWSRWFHRCPARRLAQFRECQVHLAAMP